MECESPNCNEAPVIGQENIRASELCPVEGCQETLTREIIGDREWLVCPRDPLDYGRSNPVTAMDLIMHAAESAATATIASKASRGTKAQTLKARRSRKE